MNEDAEGCLIITFAPRIDEGIKKLVSEEEYMEAKKNETHN